jgi:hypothetical protein
MSFAPLGPAASGCFFALPLEAHDRRRSICIFQLPIFISQYLLPSRDFASAARILKIEN